MDSNFYTSLPRNGTKREALREKGQFWTPQWVAEAMVTYVLADNATDHLYDIGAGAGAFLVAAKHVAERNHRRLHLLGCEVDVGALRGAVGLTQRELGGVEIRDFIENPPKQKFRAIVSNPPYIRHHRLSAREKALLAGLSQRVLGFRIDGRAGYHVYFLVQALSMLERGGKLAFIMPADTCEGVFADRLWRWIARRFCLERVVTFDHHATPFPGVDTNAVIFLIRHTPPNEDLTWIKCLEPNNGALTQLLAHGLRDKEGGERSALVVVRRMVAEALATGLSREPRTQHDECVLGDFAHVMRGIVTGANEFFFLTRARARELRIPRQFLRDAIGRTRDVSGDRVTLESLAALEQKGRPTALFFPNGVERHEMPLSVQRYIASGERMGLPQRALIATRAPWYRMEVRVIPPILFAYLGRRNARFIRNEAHILPLTAFLCVYPHSTDPEDTEKLWRILERPETTANLRLVGKSYGSGAIKVEPRALERLPMNAALVERFGLRPSPHTPSLFTPSSVALTK